MNTVEQCKKMYNISLKMNNMSEIILHSSWQIIRLQDEYIRLKKTLTTSLCVLVVDFVTGSKMSGFPFNSSSKASWSCCLLLSLAPATISSRMGISVAETWLGHSIVWTIHHLGLRKRTQETLSGCKQWLAQSEKAFCFQPFNIRSTGFFPAACAVNCSS